MTLTLLVVAAVVAVLDWVAVERTLHRIEMAAKPLTLALLVAAACTADLGTAKPWVIAALALGLAGDIALMFAKDDGSIDGPFLLGLASFLGGHVCYIVAFTRHGVHPLQIVAAVLVVGGAAVLTTPTIVKSVLASSGQELAAVVGVYATALGAMAVLGVGTSAVATAIGALLFLASDTVLAWGRFVSAIRRGPLIVIVTYHLAQLLILIGLIRR